MPTNKELERLIKRVDMIFEKLDQHLIEGTGVKTDIKWLTKWTWVSIGSSVTTLGMLIVYLLAKR